ncbi:MAG: nucleotidyltransferase domain-containing protein [Candidatus Magasanikbacteria bacterium]|nr:nucleotidyltransferase domain-containing protein [Candidatus Magasanikbacteria bacterium]
MFSRSLIQQIEERFTAEFPKYLVLLGGSYFWGTANDQSDLDLYCIVPLLLAPGAIKKSKLLVKEFPEANLNVTIVPRFFYTHGWLSVVGEDLNGIKHQSKFNYAVDLVDTIKLAGFYYLKSLVASGNLQEYWLKKASARVNYLDNLKFGQSRPEFINDSAKYDPEFMRENILRCINNFLVSKFRLRPHYFIYNLFFLARGSALWLFKNPDKMVLSKLKFYLEHPEEVTARACEDLAQIVFPVIIVHS